MTPAVDDNKLYTSSSSSVTFDNSLADYFSGYNGTDLSANTVAGSHYYNSAAYGGSNPTDHAITQQFLSAMGSSTTRYMDSFCVAQITSGTGTVGEGYSGTYPFLGTGEISRFFSSDGRFSFATWLSPRSDFVYIRGYNESSQIQTYLNGVVLRDGEGKDGTDYHRLGLGTYHHVAVAWKPTVYSILSVLPIYMPIEADIAFCAPVLQLGGHQILPHSCPIRSLPNMATWV